MILISLVTSISIEFAQYIFNLGWCEVDDVISNTLGAVIGCGLYFELRKICIKFGRDSHVN